MNRTLTIISRPISVKEVDGMLVLLTDSCEYVKIRRSGEKVLSTQRAETQKFVNSFPDASHHDENDSKVLFSPQSKDEKEEAGNNSSFNSFVNEL
jgi:hypothetical protein